MPEITVASFNIEKNGQTSELEKQVIVSTFVDDCMSNEIDIIFLCEVHSRRVVDYLDFMDGVYSEFYEAVSSFGGHSNSYIVMWRKDLGLTIDFAPLQGLNRNILMCGRWDANMGCEIAIGLAHFKSGQSNLTKSQIESASEGLNGISNGKWALLGDMNWDFGNVTRLRLPQGSQPIKYWEYNSRVNRNDPSKLGGNLDWCIGGSNTVIKALDGLEAYGEAVDRCEGPDHKPILYRVTYP